MRIGTIIDGAEALHIYRQGVGDPLAWPPEIPDGCNTGLSRFVAPGGRPALAIRQTGFRRARGEGEVNGLSVLIALDGDGEAAYSALELLACDLLEIDK